MVDNDSVKPFPVVDSEFVCLLSKAEICEITSQYLDLVWILLAEIVQGSASASNNHESGLLFEQVMGYGKPNTCPNVSVKVVKN